MNSNSQYRFWNTLTSYLENHSLAHKLREPLREFPETAKDFRQYWAIYQAAIMLRSWGLTNLALNGAAAYDKGTGVVICESLGWSWSFACKRSVSKYSVNGRRFPTD